jgi:hypothetical protein
MVRSMRTENPLRIFLSHTSELREHPRERSYVAAAESAVMRAGHAISNMAYFAARDTEPADYCAAEVGRTDVFVGIVGMRYGATVRGRPEVSYTELEFEAATAAGIPRLILLVRDDAVGLPLVEQSADHLARQVAFRRRLQDAGVTIAWATSPAEAELGLYQALVELRAARSVAAPATVMTGHQREAGSRQSRMLWTYAHPKADAGWWTQCLFEAACDAIGQPDATLAAIFNSRGAGSTSPAMVQALRNGEIPPGDVLMAALMAAGADLAALVESLNSGRGSGRLDNVNRRQFLGTMAGLVGLTGAGQVDPEPWERLAYAIQYPKRIDEETVAQLEHMTAALEKLEASVSPTVLLGPVEGHLKTLTDLLQGVPRSAMQQRVVALASETAGIASWLQWDLGTTRHNKARSYVRTALEAAYEAGDRPLGAYLIGTASVVEHPKGDAEGRLRVLRSKPFGFALDDATSATRSWLAAIEGEAYALLQREVDSRRALDVAQKAATTPADDSSARPRATFFDAARLAGEQGICLATLGHPAESLRVLQASLTDLAPGQEKNRPRLLAALGTAHVQQGNVDEACRLGAEALRASVNMAVQPNMQDVLNLRQRLEPWEASPQVRDLDDLIASTRDVA